MASVEITLPEDNYKREYSTIHLNNILIFRYNEEEEESKSL